MSRSVPWCRLLLMIFASLAAVSVEIFCVLSASTFEERCFLTTLLIASALAIGFASRRAWFGLLCAAAVFGLIFASSALKFKYLAVPAIAPDLYYFWSFDTVKVVADYPLLALASLALIAGFPLLLWLAWHADVAAAFPAYSTAQRRRWRRLGLVGSFLILVASLTPRGLFPQVYGKPMWVAVNDQSFISNFLTSFYDTQITIPEANTAPDPSISWSPPSGSVSTEASADGFATFDKDAQSVAAAARRPDIVAVLEESTFDPMLMTVCQQQPLCHRAMFEPDARTVAHGLLGVHTFGGGTWTSEFAFITGLAHTLFGNAGLYAPYNLAPRVQFSIAKSLKAQGYRVVALYPMKTSFINADNAYREYGFDALYDGAELGLKSHPRDAQVFDLFWKLYQQERLDHPRQPLFFFVLTLRQHGPHMTPLKKLPAPYRQALFPGQFSRSNRALDDWLNLNVANYLQRNAESDIAMQALQSRLLDRDTPSILLHFGDHQPAFDGAMMVVEQQLPPDWGDQDHWATYYLLKSNIPGATRFDYPMLDIVFLGGLLLDAAGVPPDRYYGANRMLRERCAGRFEECADPRWLPSYQNHIFHQIGILGLN